MRASRRARPRAQSRRKVEGSPAVAVADRDRLAGIEPDPDAARQLGLDEPSLQVDRRAKGLASGHEDDERLVAPELEEETVARRHDLGDELAESGRQGSAGFIAVLARVRRIAADVGDQERPQVGLRAWPTGSPGWPKHPSRRRSGSRGSVTWSSAGRTEPHQVYESRQRCPYRPAVTTGVGRIVSARPRDSLEAIQDEVVAEPEIARSAMAEIECQSRNGRGERI